LDWVFPYTEAEMVSALTKDATHLLTNTIPFSYLLQCSPFLDPYQDTVEIIGQPPNLVEKFDGKEYVNNLLRKTGKFTLSRGWSITKSSSEERSLGERLKGIRLPYPAVGKPVRGRGSCGVRVCSSVSALEKHIKELLNGSPVVMIEEYLSGEQATVTVMPPGNRRDEDWALPIVTRCNHSDGVVPYNGVTTLTANS
jgi:carbamoylphosphate synthase large subunit